MTRWIAAALAAILLAGCGGKDAISDEEAQAIAALSQDAELHSEGFASAIQELSKRDDCSAEFMREGGGFWRVAGEGYYFLYCAEPMNKATRWYFDPSSDKLTRFSSEI